MRVVGRLFALEQQLFRQRFLLAVRRLRGLCVGPQHDLRLLLYLQQLRGVHLRLLLL